MYVAPQRCGCGTRTVQSGTRAMKCATGKMMTAHWMDCLRCGAASQVHPEQVWHGCGACQADSGTSTALAATLQHNHWPGLGATSDAMAGSSSTMAAWQQSPAMAKDFDSNNTRFTPSESPDIDQRVVGGRRGSLRDRGI